METPVSNGKASMPVKPAAALAAGLACALRCWPVLLALWLGTLAAALPPALTPANQLMALASRPVIGSIADGLDSWQALDAYGLLMGRQAALIMGREGAAVWTETPPGLAEGLAGLAWAGLLAPLLGWVVFAFLDGGALMVYREAPAPFRLSRFLAGCLKWFGAFLALGALQAGLFLAGFLPAALLALRLAARAGLWGALSAGLLAALALAAWLALFETARVWMAAADCRNPLRALRRAAVLLLRRPAALAGFYAAALFGLLALNALFRLVFLPAVPQELILPAVLAQQSFILLRLLARAARLAGLLAMVDYLLQ